MTKRYAAREKSRVFALRMIKVYQYLQEQKREYILSKQLLRSGTAIGALVREAEQAESRADFVHKLSIALKEANETEYWLELLTESGYLEPLAGRSVMADVKELLKILTAIIKTTKTRG
ncbi:MAG: four helix bundle protein [Pseudomonadales bacterium]|nr:four helix bundle protein [Pseudomonadales bacterium]